MAYLHQFVLHYRQYHGIEGSYRLKDDDHPIFTTFAARLESAEQYMANIKQSETVPPRLIKVGSV